MTDTRNVTDQFKGWETELIRDELDTRRAPYITAIENVNGDFNKACIIRSHNVFLGQEVWIIGRKGWDTRGAVGAQHYEWIHHFPNWHEALEHYFTNILEFPVEYEGWEPMATNPYRWVAVEQDERAVPLNSYEWQPKTVMIFGEEGRGLSQLALSICDDVVYIPQQGSIRSLNVATAAGIAMYDYSNKTGILV